MRRDLVAWVMVLVLWSQACWAHQPASPVEPNDFKPASTNVPGSQYPQVNSARQVMFRIYAPDAQSVRVSLGNTALTKGDDGFWTGVTKPLDPGFHYYTINIDGVSVADPASESFFGSSSMQSGIEVPAEDQDFYQPKDVPHGEVRSKWYFSNVTAVWRRCFVYTPPDYDTNTGVRYPVLYLQHGWGEDARGWSTQGYANFILDNLIAEGKARPMILVMDDGNITGGFGRGRGARGERGTPGRRGGGGIFSMGAQFTDVMIKDIIPMIDSTYRTLADREHRAMAGLSMGGMQMFNITMNNLDKFAYMAGFSPALPPDPINRIYEDPNGFNKKVKVFFLGAGGRERQSNPNIWNLHETLAKAGIKSVYYESPGTAHEWLTWRRHLREFVPLLFKD
jgi:enterochelin esterase-like enzyme